MFASYPSESKNRIMQQVDKPNTFHLTAKKIKTSNPEFDFSITF